MPQTTAQSQLQVTRNSKPLYIKAPDWATLTEKSFLYWQVIFPPTTVLRSYSRVVFPAFGIWRFSQLLKILMKRSSHTNVARQAEVPLLAFFYN